MRILLVQCLANDYDGQMDRMGATLEKGYTGSGHKVRKLDYTVLDALLGSRELGKFHKVVIAGHSRFLDENLKPIPLSKRTIGGYNLDEVARKVYYLGKSHLEGEEREVFFCNCEVALSNATRVLYTDNRSKTAELCVEHPFIEPDIENEPENTSSLQYIASKLLETARAHWNLDLKLKLRGLNGIGHLTPKDFSGRTFDQKHLAWVNQLVDLEASTKKGKGVAKRIAELTGRLESFIQGKPSPHQIAYQIDSSAHFV